MKTSQKIGMLLGPILFGTFNWLISFEGLSASGHAVLAVTLWVSTWWVTEVISLAATSILPIIVLPISGGLSMAETTKAYGHPLIFLFFGGFILAIAIEKWQLHKRLALNIILFSGVDVGKNLFGFMAATAFLSMWISNTATTVMLLPIALAVIKWQGDQLPPDFARALMLGIAYAASIGGMATLIGTPPNLVLAGIIRDSYQVELSFIQWSLFALPLCILLFFGAWWYLKRTIGRRETKTTFDHQTIRQELVDLGPMSRQERAVALVFLGMIFLWTFRSVLIVQWVPELNDTGIALIGALVLFLLPAGPSGKLVEWSDTRNLPWGILILFGGGMAIANGFESSGLAQWVGFKLVGAQSLPVWLLLLIIVAGVNFLTEITSNMATTAIMLPVLLSLTAMLGVHAYLLAVPATIAASCAFMLPVATAPNALVFSSGQVKIQEMVKYGFWFNITSIAIVTVYTYWLVPVFFSSN
jgi:sodium-dependent dicarboxylate transporter 2/3/5